MCLPYVGGPIWQRTSTEEDKCQSVVSVAAHPAFYLMKTCVALRIHVEVDFWICFFSVVSCIIFPAYCILLYLPPLVCFRFVVGNEKLADTRHLVRVFNRFSKERSLNTARQMCVLDIIEGRNFWTRHRQDFRLTLVSWW
jgi:hypothetical protein